MRWLIAILIVGFVGPSFAEKLRVVTWNLQWFPSGSQNKGAPEVEAKRIEDAASVLKRIAPDIILVQEVRDLQTCERLAAAVGTNTYSVAICSSFKEKIGGVVGRQQVAILSKQNAWLAFAEPWKSFQLVDPPRGFSFAAFRVGTNDIAFYSLHLKSNLIKSADEREHQLNMLKRELAAEQLLRHSRDVGAQITNAFEIIVVGGDFNTNMDDPKFASENTLRAFLGSGFSTGFETVEGQSRITCPGKGRYPDATFDYIVVKGARGSVAHVTDGGLSDHFPVYREIEF